MIIRALLYFLVYLLCGPLKALDLSVSYFAYIPEEIRLDIISFCDPHSRNNLKNCAIYFFNYASNLNKDLLLYKNITLGKGDFVRYLVYYAERGDEKYFSSLLNNAENFNLDIHNKFIKLYYPDILQDELEIQDIMYIYKHKKNPKKIALNTLIDNQDSILLYVYLGNSVNIYIDKYNNTLLHFSVDNNNKFISTLLLKAGADINSKNESGETALHCAARKGYAEIVALLISYGADEFLKDNKGHNPLKVAKKYKQKDCIKLLKSKKIFFSKFIIL
jgi:hypothetical protein